MWYFKLSSFRAISESTSISLSPFKEPVKGTLESPGAMLGFYDPSLRMVDPCYLKGDVPYPYAICTYIYIYVYIYIYIYLFVHIYIYVYMSVDVYIYMRI